MLTPTDVEQKTFSTALRGYDLDEVDDFLDEIVATLRNLNEQLDAARSGIEAVPVVPAPEPVPVVAEPELVPEPMPAPQPPEPAIDESAIGRALVAAQTTADKLLEDAEEEATRIVDEAKGEADTWRVERDTKKAEAEAEMAALADRVSSIRSELSVLAGELADKLDEMDEVIEEGVADDSADDSAADSAADSADEDGPEVATVEVSGDEGEGSNDADDTDELVRMLNGVANDLQLASDEETEVDSDDSDQPGEDE